MKPRFSATVMLCLAAILPGGVAHSQATTFTRWFGGPKYDEGFCARPLNDGGFIVVGTSLTLLSARYNDVFAIRTNCTGDTLWTRTIGTTDDEDGFSVCGTFDGGFAMAGTTSSRPADTVSVYIVKLDSTGATDWTKTLRPSMKDYALSICETPDSGLAIAGIMGSGPHGRSDAWLIRMNRLGDTLWSKTYGGVADDGLRNILLMPDNGFLLTGYTNSLGGGSFDCYVVRTNALGDTLWTKTYGGPDAETGWSADAVDDSGFIVGGIVTHGVPPTWTSRFFLVRMGEDGDTLWTKAIDGATNESRFSVRHTHEGGFAFVGTTVLPGREEDALLVKTDRWGETQWWRSFGGQTTDYGSSLQQCADGGFVIAGMVAENTFDAYLVKTDESGLITGAVGGTATGEPSMFHLVQNYPNPFNPTTTIGYSLPSQGSNFAEGSVGEGFHVVLKVYDLLGREVATLVNETKQPGPYTVQWDARGMASGVYFCRLTSGGFVETKKLVLLR